MTTDPFLNSKAGPALPDDVRVQPMKYRHWMCVGALATALVLTSCLPAQKRMLETMAMRDAMELRSALMNFQAEYRRFPTLSDSQADGDWVGETTPDLITGLIGEGDKDWNPRKITFYAARMAEKNRSGLTETSSGEYQLIDPWGNPYQVAIDTNYDQKLSIPQDGADSLELRYEVAVWSCGVDGVSGTDDDVRTF